jgi:hypothetical protein
VLFEVLPDVFFVEQVRQQGHCDVFLWKFDQPFGLDLFGYFEQITQELVENVE